MSSNANFQAGSYVSNGKIICNYWDEYLTLPHQCYFRKSSLYPPMCLSFSKIILRFLKKFNTPYPQSAKAKPKKIHMTSNVLLNAKKLSIDKPATKKYIEVRRKDKNVV